MIPQDEYSQQQQDAIPHHRNPHQIHEATMAPTLQTDLGIKMVWGRRGGECGRFAGGT